MPRYVDDLRGRIDFAILTVLADEFEAVLQRLPGHEPVRGGKHVYEYAALPTASGHPRRIAVVRSLEEGQGAAQSATRDVIEELDPGWIVLCGIAGAAPHDEVTLGDVALASRLHDFSVSAALKGEVEYAQGGGPVHRDVARVLAALPAWRERLGDWNSEASIGYARPNLEVEEHKLYGDDKHKNKVRKVLGHRPASRRPEYGVGSCATANVLVKDVDLLHRWQESARHLTHVEMEAGGAYVAARQGGDREYPLLCVRGISDVVGLERDSEWAKYACNTAASFLVALLKAELIDLPARPGPRLEIHRNEEAMEVVVSNEGLGLALITRFTVVLEVERIVDLLGEGIRETARTLLDGDRLELEPTGQWREILDLVYDLLEACGRRRMVPVEVSGTRMVTVAPRPAFVAYEIERAEPHKGLGAGAIRSLLKVLEQPAGRKEVGLVMKMLQFRFEYSSEDGKAFEFSR